jgi:hypothetical protein
VGWIVVAVGAVVAVVGGLADQLGLGGEGPDEFGPQQWAAVLAGLVIVAIGLAVALWRPSPRRSHPRGTAGADHHPDPAT